MTAPMIDTQWLTRYGAPHTGGVHAVDLARGTAKHYTQEPCTRCGGAGGWRGWPGFTCYRCAGDRFEPVAEVTVYTPEALAKLNAAQAKRNATKVAKAQAAAAVAQEAAAVRFQAFQEARPALAAGLARYATGDRFLGSIEAQARDRGTLTEAQEAAALRAIERLEAQALAKAASTHVGTVGERLELVLVVEHTIRLESNLPAFYHAAPSTIYLCRDAAGNRVVYKGSGSLAAKGETVRCKATVAEHGERNGELQTVVARPKVIEVIEGKEN
jgi:hypothetical protein